MTVCCGARWGCTTISLWWVLGLQILVHPVVPVLDVTRPVVLAFNKQLHAAVVARPELRWLDGILDKLLVDGKASEESHRGARFLVRGVTPPRARSSTPSMSWTALT